MSATADPAVKAAEELTAIFERLEVPCAVRVSEGSGKHVVATRAIPDAGFVLVEEVPVVSWPTRSYLRLQLPFCFHCLRRDRSGHREADGAEVWSRCEGCNSSFCSDSCRAAGRDSHRLLCAALAPLRAASDADDDGSTNTTATGSGRVEGKDGATTTTTTGTAAAGATAEASNADVEGSITRESVARCAAWLVARAADIIRRQQLTHADLGDAATVRQVFSIAAAPFDRLIGAPDSAEISGVADPAEWYTLVRTLLETAAQALLCEAAGSSGTTTTAAAPVPAWVGEFTEAALSDSTLRTLLGQLVLNAHAINDYILVDKDTTHDDEAATGSGGIPFAWVMKGAGVYSLLSTLNHSCEPNVAITYVDGTNEIAIKTTRPIAAGEELHNTYIPLKKDSTAQERRAMLKGYFFTCMCPRCVAEDRAAKA